MNTEHTQKQWIERARVVFPAGGFGNFDPSICIRNAKGSRVRDEDGKEYVDYLIGSGPMILGHGHPEVLESVQAQLLTGWTYFANNAAGIIQRCLMLCLPTIRFITIEMCFPRTPVSMPLSTRRCERTAF